MFAATNQPTMSVSFSFFSSFFAHFFLTFFLGVYRLRFPSWPQSVAAAACLLSPFSTLKRKRCFCVAIFCQTDGKNHFAM